MSEANVELVRRGLADVNFFWDLLDEDVVWDLTGTPVMDLSPTYEGREAVIAASRHYFGTWSDYQLQARELIDAGTRVVVVLREQGRGKGSGAPFDRLFAQLWTFRAGRIVRWEVFSDKAAAMEAAGLSEK
jgi:ketosteroid isomerase-like protein